MGKNYLITGGTSGIGLSCLKMLSEEGNTLVIVGRNKDRLENVKKTVSCNIVSVEYDLEDIENISDIFEIIEEKGIILDGMVYSAGIDSTFPVKANKPLVMQSIMNVNCISFVEMCKFFYRKRISKESSSVVAISSIASLLNEKGMVAYSASKAALNSTIKTISKEFIRRGIRVNGVLPSGVDTEMARKKILELQGTGDMPHDNNCDIEKAIYNATSKKDNAIDYNGPQPFGIIESNAVAELVCFLLSDSAKYMTGELIPISAGRAY